jgi:hypothetical protein
MTISLFWRVQTDDLDSWLNPDPDALWQMLQSQGVLSSSLCRGTDDPNSVVVQMQFADRDAVDAFEAWYGPMREEWAKQWRRSAPRSSGIGAASHAEASRLTR